MLADVLLLTCLMFLMLLLAARLGADEDPAPLPLNDAQQAELDRVLDSNLGDPLKAYSAYKAVLAKAQEKTLKDLEKEKLEVSKRGDLDLATAVMNAIAKVKSGALADRLLNKALANDLYGNGRTLADLVVGKKFAFANANGFLTNLTLERDGRILGNQHRNETFWKTDEEAHLLLFFRDDQVKSSVFNTVTLVKGKLEFQGEFQFGSMKHTLKEIE